MHDVNLDISSETNSSKKKNKIKNKNSSEKIFRDILIINKR